MYGKLVVPVETVNCFYVREQWVHRHRKMVYSEGAKRVMKSFMLSMLYKAC